MEDEVVETATAPLCQTSSVGDDEDSSFRDRSTDNNITKDVDHKVRNNDDRTIESNTAEDKETEKQSTKDDKGETVNSWYAGDMIARVPSSQEKSDDDEKSRTTKMNNKKEFFLWKIHEILEDISKEQKEHIVSWSPRGTSFKVHNPEAFVQEVMPRYSTATQFRSFEKMLNLYDFKKIKGGPYRGGYQHPLFRRDNRELCKKIKMRPKPKRKTKGSRVSVGGEKSHMGDDDIFSGFDKDMPEQRKSLPGNLEDDEDRHLSSIDDISMGYFQKMATGAPTNLEDYNESLAQVQAEGHTNNFYQNILNMRTSHRHQSSLIGVTGSSSGNITLMEDVALGTSSSSGATTNLQQQFAIFDHPIMTAIPSSTTRSATSTVAPVNLSGSRHDHSAATAAALSGRLMQSPTTMMGSEDFGVVGGGIMQSFSAGGIPLMSTGLSEHTPTTIFMSTRTTAASRPTPTLSVVSQTNNPISLDHPPPFHSSLLDLGGRRGDISTSGMTNFFVDPATKEQQALRRRSWSYSSAMASTTSNSMIPPVSSSSFDHHSTMIMTKGHRGHHEEKHEEGCDDDDHHDHYANEVERSIFEEPLSDDLEPTHLPPP